MLQPGLDESQGRLLVLQPRVEVLHERGGQRHVGIRELREDVDELFRLSFRDSEHAVGPGDGHVPFLAPTGDAHPHAANVFE